jgi:hypothetical protein
LVHHPFTCISRQHILFETDRQSIPANLPVPRLMHALQPLDVASTVVPAL